MSTFPAREGLQAQKDCILCNPILKCAVDKLDRFDHDGGVGR